MIKKGMSILNCVVSDFGKDFIYAMAVLPLEAFSSFLLVGFDLTLSLFHCETPLATCTIV